MSISLEIARVFDNVIQAKIEGIWEFNRLVRDAMRAQVHGTNAIFKLQQEVIDSHIETHQHIVTAIEAVQRTKEVIADPAKPDQTIDLSPDNQESERK